MNKLLFTFIFSCLMCVAIMTTHAQTESSIGQYKFSSAQQQEYAEQYYREFKIDSRNGKYGILFRGEEVVPYEYDAIVAQQNNNGFITKQGNKYGVISVITTYYVSNSNTDNNPREGWKFLIEKGVRAGERKIDINLTTSIVPCEFDEIKVIDRKYRVSKGSLKGVLSSAGRTIVRCEFDEIKVIDGKYWVSKGSKKGILNSVGSTIVSCEFDDIKVIEGKYWVSKGSLKGILNSVGSTIVRCDFDKIELVDGKYWVSKGSLKGVLNSVGSTIVSCEFDDIKVIEGKYWVSKGKLKGVLNSVGSTIVRCEFDDIKIMNGRYWVSKGKLKGVFNSVGSTIVRCEFDKIELTSEGRYIAYKDGKKNLYNSSGGLLHTDGSNIVYSTN